MFEIKVDNREVLLINQNRNSKETIIDFKEVQNNVSTIHSEKLLESFTSMLKNYRTMQKYTYGETTMIDILALVSLVFKELMTGNHTGIRALEVGSWFGCSSYFFANSLKTFSDDNYLFCMDTWQGSPDTASHNIANFENAFEHFKSVMKYGGVYDNIKPIVCDSTIGMDVLQDNYFDIIFVDANHTYDYVYQDIIKGIKKIKVGGLLMGHDCECYADELPPHILHGDNKHLDGIEGYHAGVIKALNDIFGRSYLRFNSSLVWYKRITQEDKDRVLQLEGSELKQLDNGIFEMAQTMKEAIQYLCANVAAKRSEQLNNLVNDLVLATNKLEDELLPICEKNYYKDLKISTNTLKNTLIDFKINYDDNNPKAIDILESKVIDHFNNWVECFEKSNLFVMQ